MRRLPGAARAILALIFATAAAMVPIGKAAACSCGWSGYEEAIAGADVAFVGTVVAMDAPPLIGGGAFTTVRHSFDVRRSKTPIQSPFVVEVASGSEAGCGLDMAVGEEWVVIASVWDEKLQTNLCSGSALAADLERGELGRIEHALAPNDLASVPEPSGFALDVPAPVIGILAVALIILGVGFVAFRRDRLS
jgi:hypothetical protein